MLGYYPIPFEYYGKCVSLWTEAENALTAAVCVCARANLKAMSGLTAISLP